VESEFENPSCLHAIFESTAVHPSSHTVPQSPFRHTSTLPFILEEPFLSLMLPSMHPECTVVVDNVKTVTKVIKNSPINSLGIHWTPASSVCEQLAVLLSNSHSISLGSYTVQETSTTAMMMVVSGPKCELPKAVASVKVTIMHNLYNTVKTNGNS